MTWKVHNSDRGVTWKAHKNDREMGVTWKVHNKDRGVVSGGDMESPQK